MKHIIISDTHTPQAIKQTYEYCKELLTTQQDVDAIVINGDLLGIFSIEGSKAAEELDAQGRMQLLEEAAPGFAASYKSKGAVKKDMVATFVAERYEWAYQTIKKFSELKFTIFNLGNHESEHHLLVLQELPFLTKCPDYLLQETDKEALKPIVKDFEKRLIALEEEEGNFKYIRDKPIIINKTLILGIPGESHATTGNEPLAQLQEKKTEALIEKVKPHLGKVHSIIIYNHTQGDYNKQTGAFWSASKSLSAFMKELPENILQQVYVQSHNHWSYSQFLTQGAFTFLLNNAGIHEGICNLIHLDILGVECYDLDPTNKKMTPLKLSTKHPPVRNDKELIQRFYDDADYIMHRKRK